MLKDELPDETPSGAQGSFFNLRRDKFQDIRVRQALNLAFDFEWTNDNLFYRSSMTAPRASLRNRRSRPKALRQRKSSYLLEPMRDKLRPEVFGEIAIPQKSDGSGQDRKIAARRHRRLLDEAGWKLDGNVRRNAKGETFAIEVLIDDPTFRTAICALYTQPEALRHRCSDCARSIRSNMSSARRILISILSSGALLVGRDAGQRVADLLSARIRRSRRAATIFPASPALRSTR